MMASRRPPGPGRNPWMETARVRRLGAQAYIQDLVTRYGDTVLVQIGQFHAYLLSHPTTIQEVLTRQHSQMTKGRETKRLSGYIGNGLLTSEGEVHQRQRRLMNPLFHRRVVAGHAATMADYTEQVISGWQEGAVIDLNQSMSQLTMLVATKKLLDLDLEAEEAQTLYQDLRTTLRVYTDYLGLPFDLLINLHFLPATRAYDAAMRRLETALIQRIVARQATNRTPNDLLTLLLAAHGGEEDVPEEVLSTPEVRDQIMTLFFAGQETLGSALPWAFLSLAHDPEMAERLRVEVDEVLGDRRPTAEDLPHLRYTTQVLQETLRLYPPIIALSRQVEEPLEVDGYPIGVGSHLYMSQFAVHRDARWWPDPLRFDPERFAPEVETQRPKFAYFPFGGGPRQCIGEGFAQVEGLITLATLAQRWRLEPVTTRMPRFSANILALRPREPIRVRVMRRS